ncbi:MAG TPA: vWA domain-containing protein [Terracidiphilus sp.]|jgi:Flp pilus assembly protein TadG
MSRICKHLFGRLMSQGGSVAVWWALLIPLSFGVGGVVVDVGYAYTCQRELQMSTNAAAMAAAALLPNASTAQTAGYQFSAEAQTSTLPKGVNYYGNLPSVTASVVTGCVSITYLPSCGGSITANAVQVTQTTTIPTFFIKAMTVFGVKGVGTINLAARSTAVMRGAQRGPFDVAIVMDATGSMSYTDGGSNCTGTKAQCAEEGAQILLSEFSPCLPGLSNCGSATNGNVSNAVDEVSLFTFPAAVAGTQIAGAQTCNSTQSNTWSTYMEKYPDSTSYATVSHSNPTMPGIGTGSGQLTTANLNTLVSQYQIAPLESNYRTSDVISSGSNPLTITSSGVSSTNPSIVNAVGGNNYFGGTGCTGVYVCPQAQNGGAGCVSTYFAGALFTAQEYLAQNGRSNANNVMILLSDGDANGGTMGAGSTHLNSTGNYPSSTKQCQQAVDIAKAAKAAGTKIYVVGYGVTSGGCATDTSYNACTTLRAIASSDSNFFVDTSSVKCAGATTVTMNGKTNSLSAIFSAIAGDLTLPRMVPNTIAFTPN